MLDFRLETFLDLCHTQSYTKTAENLNITQPAVSQHVRYLEQYYDVKLILYQNHQFSLTEEGKYLLKEISNLHSLSEKIKKNIKTLATFTDPPIIRIGSNPTIGEFVLPGLISDYTKRNPDCRISCLIGSPEQLEQQMQKGDIDFIITDSPNLCPELEHRLFCREPIFCVCNANHPLANKTVSLSIIQRENIVYRKKDSHAYDILKNTFYCLGYNLDTFKITLETGSMYSCIQYVKNSQCISFLYRCAVNEYLESKELSLIHIPELKEYVDFYCIYPRTIKDSAFSKDFLAFCLSQQIF